MEAHGESYVATHAQTFADVSPGELIVYEDTYRTLALAINRGDAAGTLALKPDDEVDYGRNDRPPRVHRRVTDSTNERAKELAAAGARTARSSRRTSRRPAAAPGPPMDGATEIAVLMSVVLRELDELLPLAAAVAVATRSRPRQE